MDTLEPAATGSSRADAPAHGGIPRELAADLRTAVEGEVRFEDADRALYAYDASIYRQVPIGVVVPKHAGDVEAALAVCREHGVPILGRGCGTSLAGQCCNAAVVIDFSKFMHGIVELDPHGKRARVLPGTICDTVRHAAEPYGLTWGPDPQTHDHCTFGGMIGNNSCGTHSIYAGKTVDNVERLEILTYDGLRMSVGATGERELAEILRGGGRRAEIYGALDRIRTRYGDAVRRTFPKIPRRVSGYNLDSLLPENGFDVAKALVGTESTCVLVLEATVRLVRQPPKRTIVVLGFPDIPSSGDIVPEVLRFQPIGTEFFAARVIRNLERKHLRYAKDEGLLPPGEAFVIVEFGGETQAEADDKAHALEAMLRAKPDGPEIRFYGDPQDETAIWEIRKHSAGTSRMPIGLGHHGGWPNWEDAAVAPERLGDFLRGQLRIHAKYGYDPVFFGHWGQGCIHQRIDFDFRTAHGIARFRAFMEESADVVVSLGGSISGEHGDGQGRAELVSKMYPPEVMQAFRDFKAVWDPRSRMNPGKMIDAYRMDQNLREGSDYRFIDLDTVFRFPQDGNSFAEAANRCFGVGKCRHFENGTMCPSFMATREEKHSTRGRARLLQEMMRSGGTLESRWRNDAVHEALDLCLACKGCKGDCPVQVDMASYKAEFLHHYYKGRVRPLTAYAMGLIMYWARIAARNPRLANALAHAPLLSDLMKRAIGIAPQRALPRFAERTFKQWFATHAPRHPDGPPVILWADTFNNHFLPQTAIAAVEVLEDAGFRVDVPQAALCCGRPLYDYGMLLTAKRFLREILDALRPQIQAGVPVVGLEPSCVAVFREELLNMFPNDLDAQRLQKQTRTLAEFLTALGDAWSPPQLHRKALVQAHCHHKAVMGFDEQEHIFSKLGLDAEVPDSGCCGMAGSFGYEAGEHYAVSQACGERVILPKVRDASSDTLVLADGFSCREQIEQNTGIRPLHLAEVIRIAQTARTPPTQRVAPPRDGTHGGAQLAEYALLAVGAAALGALALRRTRHGGKR